MILWCDIHRENHRFTQGEVERIAYTLQAALADAESKPQVFGQPTPICLNEVSGWSWDFEGYYEHTGALVERRRAEAKSGGAS